MSDIINHQDFENAAKEKLPQLVYDFFAGGAGDELTLCDNRQAYGGI